MNIYITFGGRAYDERIAQTVEAAPRFGADRVLVYDDRWLVEQSEGQTGFRGVNAWLWETKRRFGFGWCAWKPYIILDAMARARNGDVVWYVDADCVPIADLRPLYDTCRQEGVLLFDCQGFSNSLMTRRDCFVAMGLDQDLYWDAKGACARFCAFRVGDFMAHQILTEWWAYSINPLCQQWEDYTSAYAPEFPHLHRHSTEQSVLSLLRSKYDLPLHREADGFGWPVDEKYCAEHHIRHDFPMLFEQVYCQGNRLDVSGSRFRNVPLVGGL